MKRMDICPRWARHILIDAKMLTDYMVDYYSLQVIGMWKLRRNRAGTD